MPRVGGERIMVQRVLKLLWLVLNHTGAKKGRGIPEITKLGRFPSLPYYLIYK